MISASVYRLFELGKVPIGLEWDEVALGYDAYSILKTGKDQFGKFLPLTFRSLDDWKPPIYEYATVPAEALLGLTPFATRLPSALFGILTVCLTFIFTRIIVKNIPIINSHANTIALLASFLLTISPWHLQFSRGAFEVNISVFISLLAVYLFLKGLSKNRYFILSGLIFGINLFSYHSARVVSPILMSFLFFIFNKKLPARKHIISFFLIYGFFFVLFIPILISPEAQMRFRATNIFDPGARYLNEKDIPKLLLDKRLEDKAAGYEFAGKIFHNSHLLFLDYDTLKKAFNNYISNFGFEYLFISGDAPLHHAPDFGLLYIWELPFIVLGLFFIFSKGLNRYTVIILAWMLLVPLPNAVTREAPHSIRTELFLPSFQILASIGIFYLLYILRNESKWVIYTAIIFISATLSINHGFYLHQYYTQTNLKLSRYWMYGRKEAVDITEKLKGSYDKVLVSMKVDMPYIFWLYYSKKDPREYLRGGGTLSGGFADERNHFDKYEFRNFQYNTLPKNQKLLLVSVPGDFPSDAEVLDTVKYLDGSTAFLIARNKYGQ